MIITITSIFLTGCLSSCFCLTLLEFCLSRSSTNSPTEMQFLITELVVILLNATLYGSLVALLRLRLKRSTERYPSNQPYPSFPPLYRPHLSHLKFHLHF